MQALQGMINRLPLRVRLTLWVVGIAAVIQLAVGVVFYMYQRTAVQGFFNQHLDKRSLGMVEQLKREVPFVTHEKLVNLASAQARFSMFSGFTMSVWDQEGNLLASSREIPRTDIDPAELRKAAATQSVTFAVAADEAMKAFDPDATLARTIMRGFRGFDGRAYVLTSSTADSNAQRMLSLVARALLIAFPTGVLVSGLGGWLIAGLAVRPLETVRAAASQLSPQSISQHRISLPRSSPEQERLEKELNKAMDRLSAAFAAQERFMSNVSHELKTPIAVLMAEAQTLDTRNSPREVEVFVRSAMDELRRLGAMVDSFLVLTRVREGRALTQSRRCPVNDLVMESVQHCMPMAQQFQVTLDPRLYDGDEELCLEGDPALLRTMIDNLVRNAIRFSPRAQPIHVCASFEDGMIIVRVRDHGPGIPEAIVDRIFDRFTQAPDEQRRGRGHGLGLEIAQGIAELHGGRISVRNCISAAADHPAGTVNGEAGSEATVVSGCEFTVRLPRSGAEPGSGPANAAGNSIPGATTA